MLGKVATGQSGCIWKQSGCSLTPARVTGDRALLIGPSFLTRGRTKARRVSEVLFRSEKVHGFMRGLGLITVSCFPFA